MKTMSVLSDGTRIDELKRAAKKLKREEGIAHAEALDRVAVEQGFENWARLSAAAWTLDDDGAIRMPCKAVPGFDIRVPVYSPRLEIGEDLDLEEMSVNVSLEELGDGKFYMWVEFVRVNDGTNFRVPDELRPEFARAIESGLIADAVVAQGNLVDSVFWWYEDEFMDLDYHTICRIKRQELGIPEDDIAWEEPVLAGYDADRHAVRVYGAPGGQFLVCYEADSSPADHDDPKRIEPFALITREEFDDVPEDMSNMRATHRAFLVAAGMVRDNDDDYRDCA